MARGMGDMLVLLPMLYLMNQVDFTKEQNVFYVQIGAIIAHVTVALAYGYIYLQITSKPNNTTIEVPKAPTGFGQPSEGKDTMTVTEYDMSQWKKAMQQLGIGVLIMSVLYYKLAIIQPLFMQIIMQPMGLYRNPLAQNYILGQKVERPFPEENPLAAFLPTAPTDAPAEESKEEEKNEKNIKDKKETKKSS
eukprot:TRINITY_DN17981_c0_g1_i1.p1 TRINITY_DN17981_c0_g1~~TRINITY_DN17981_c0_g1_i1.p1  ORF type:complete len:192 (+),score=43.29 TRINITY_DN17981_c0_g1_i1:62-637(+)